VDELLDRSVAVLAEIPVSAANEMAGKLLGVKKQRWDAGKYREYMREYMRKRRAK
jgi:hypothetical protein